MSYTTGFIEYFWSQIPRLVQSNTQHSLTYTATHFSTESIQWLAIPAHIISACGFPSLTLFSHAHFTCCWKFGKKSTLFVKLPAHFPPGDVQVPTVPRLSRQFCISVTFPDQSKLLDIPTFPYCRNPDTNTIVLLVFNLQAWLWLRSLVVSVLDSGAVRPGFKSQPRCCRVTVLGKLFTPIVPLFTKQRNW